MRTELFLIMRKVLEASRRELLERSAARQRIGVERHPDLLEDARWNAERELAARNLEHGARSLRDIDEALRRLGAGVYGLCLGCGAEIEEKRLAAVPWTQFCLDCQQAAEQDGREPEEAPWPRAA